MDKEIILETVFLAIKKLQDAHGGLFSELNDLKLNVLFNY